MCIKKYIEDKLYKRSLYSLSLFLHSQQWVVHYLLVAVFAEQSLGLEMHSHWS